MTTHLKAFALPSLLAGSVGLGVAITYWRQGQITPYLIAISAGLLAWAFTRYRRSSLVPVARTMVAASLPCGIVVLDEQNRIVDLNPEAIRILGSLDSLKGRKLDAVWPRLPSVEELEARSHVETILGEGDDARCYEARLSALGEGRRPIGYLLALDDITHRRQVEQDLDSKAEELRRAHEELRRLEELYLTLTEQSPAAIYLTDAQGRCTYVNSRWCEMAGLEPEEALGYGWRVAIYPGEHARVMKVWDRLVEARGRWGIEYRMSSRSGEVTWVHGTASAILDADGELTGYVGTSVDITARKRAEERGKKMEEQLRHARHLESLGVLAGGIAHDFNNLLMVVLGNADLMLAAMAPDAAERSHLEDIVTAAQRAANLATQMLAYSGQGSLVVTPVDLSALVNEATPLLESAVGAQVALRFFLDGDLPPFSGDEAQIRELITGLVTNAAEAIGPNRGTVTVSTTMRDCDASFLGSTHVADRLEAGPYLCLQVADDGCGMDEETAAKIFEPFFTTKFTGRGLGMSAILGIVRGHKGAIKVESEPRRGTTVTVLLPVSQAAVQSEVAPVATTVDESWLGCGTILLVDDEEDVRTTAGQMLQRLGFELITASNGREAVELVGAHGDEIALVLLDMTMPEMTGKEAFEEIRVIAPDTPVILSSGYSEEQATAGILGKGLAGFVQKPYLLADLRPLLRATLGDAVQAPLERNRGARAS